MGKEGPQGSRLDFSSGRGLAWAESALGHKEES